MSEFSRLLRAYRALHAIGKKAPAERTWWERVSFDRRYRAYARAMNQKFGAHIPGGVTIGDGVKFGHEFHGIFISSDAVIGNNVTIYQHVTIGESGGDKQNRNAPIIGNDVLIGANATIIGRCIIGDGAKIGAGVTLVDAVIPPGAVIINKSAYNLTEGKPVYPEVIQQPTVRLVS